VNHEFQDDGEGGELKLFRNASLEKRKKIVLAWRATAAELFLQQAPTEKKWWDEHKDKMVSNGEATGELETTLTMFAKQIHAPGASLDQLNLQYLAHVLNVNLVIVVCALAGGAALGSPTNVDLRVHFWKAQRIFHWSSNPAAGKRGQRAALAHSWLSLHPII
jgi:hypothetical protein